MRHVISGICRVQSVLGFKNKTPHSLATCMVGLYRNLNDDSECGQRT